MTPAVALTPRNPSEAPRPRQPGKGMEVEEGMMMFLDFFLRNGLGNLNWQRMLDAVSMCVCVRHDHGDDDGCGNSIMSSTQFATLPQCLLAESLTTS